MSTTTDTVTKYAVARGEKIIAGEHTAVESAKSELAYIEGQMRAVGLEPDVRLVTFEVETTVKSSRPRAYKDPEPEAEEVEGPADEQFGEDEKTEDPEA